MKNANFIGALVAAGILPVVYKIFIWPLGLSTIQNVLIVSLLLALIVAKGALPAYASTLPRDKKSKESH